MEDDSKWPLTGRNVRRLRIVQGRSQVELARKAEVSASTIYRIERGHSISARALMKLCDALNEPIDSLTKRNPRMLMPEDSHVVFRREEALWISLIETREKIPKDRPARVQDSEERLRLGRLGLVLVFAYTTNFFMPEGPGFVLLEVYGRFGKGFNDHLYRECLVSCLRGRARLRIGDSTIELGEGDVVGYHSKDLLWMEPADPVGPEGQPTVLNWIGSVRIASTSQTGASERVKRGKRQRDQDSLLMH